MVTLRGVQVMIVNLVAFGWLLSSLGLEKELHASHHSTLYTIPCHCKPNGTVLQWGKKLCLCKPTYINFALLEPWCIHVSRWSHSESNRCPAHIYLLAPTFCILD